jgi:hypothetical protein
MSFKTGVAVVSLHYVNGNIVKRFSIGKFRQNEFPEFLNCEEAYKVDVLWRKLHNVELHSLYSSPNVVMVIKSRRLRWAGHVARMGEGRCLQGFGWEARR